MIQDTRAQFKKASTLIQEGKKADALNVLKPILAQQANNAEAWWLAAHAAPTPDAVAYACQKVLALKPDYAPARQMITDQALKKAEGFIKEAEVIQAMTILRPILAEQPNNLEALWLAARAAPTSAEAIATCQKILALKPDHEPALRMIASKQKLAALNKAHKQARKKPQRSRPWMVIGLIGIIVMVGTSLLIASIITGRGISVLPQRIKSSLGELRPNASPPAPLTDTLPVGGVREYQFSAGPNSFLLAMVLFPTVSGDPARAIKLLDESGKVVATGEGSGSPGKGMTVMQVQLPRAGTYTLQLTGMAGIAQGAYQIQMQVESMTD